MNYLVFLFLFYIISCAYPDIDSVPDFKNLTLSKEESIDLCKLINTDIKMQDDCINNIE